MSIHVLFFGKLADIAQNELGTTAIKIENDFDHRTINELITHLSQRSSTLAAAINQPGTLQSVNQTLCQRHSNIQAGDEVAFMSPLSGG